MAENHVVRFLAIWIFGSALIAEGYLEFHEDNWEDQLLEMKQMLSGMNRKMSSMENKINHLSMLDYAFKVNTIDIRIMSLNARMDQIFTHVDSIKGAIQDLKIPTCGKIPESQVNEESRSTSMIDREKSDVHVNKLDDYGRKLLRSHQNLSEMTHEHKTAINTLSEVARSGFAKVITKLDLSLELEGQMTNAMGMLQHLNVKTSDISDNIVQVTRDLQDIHSVVSTNQNLLNNLTRHVRGISRNAEEIAVPIADLTRAVQLGNDLEVQIAKFTSVEEKIEKASAMSERLMSENKHEEPKDFQAEVGNLNSLLKEIENITVPAFLSVPYLFQNLQAVVGDSLTTLSNKTRCSSEQVIQLEVKRLRDEISETCATSKESKVGTVAGINASDCKSVFNESQKNAQEEVKMELEDYAGKIVRQIQETYKEIRGELKNFMDVTKQGFTKLITKADRTLQMEDQISRINILLQGVATNVRTISEVTVREKMDLELQKLKDFSRQKNVNEVRVQKATKPSDVLSECINIIHGNDPSISKDFSKHSLTRFTRGVLTFLNGRATNPYTDEEKRKSLLLSCGRLVQNYIIERGRKMDDRVLTGAVVEFCDMAFITFFLF